MTPPSSFIQDFAHLAHLNSNGASWQMEWQLSVDSKTQTKGGCSVIWSTQQNPWEAKGKRGSEWGPWRMRDWGKSPREQSAHHVSRWEACTLVHRQAREAFHPLLSMTGVLGDILSDIKWYPSAFTSFLSHRAGADSFYLLLGSWLRSLEHRQRDRTTLCRLMSCRSHMTWEPSEPFFRQSLDFYSKSND